MIRFRSPVKKMILTKIVILFLFTGEIADAKCKKHDERCKNRSYSRINLDTFNPKSVNTSLALPFIEISE